MSDILTLAGLEVGCRWPNDGSHPDCWLPPLKGMVLDQTRALPDADKVKAHVEWCHGQGLLNDKMPVLYQGVDATGPFIQWDDLDSLLPYEDMLAKWEKAKAEKVDAIEHQRREQIKELRAEIRKTRAEMKECGIKRTSCFNRIDGGTYRFNATMFQLETRLKSLVGGE